MTRDAGRRHRLRVVEAMVALRVARLLIARVRFARWRGSLGTLAADTRAVLPPAGDPTRILRIVRAVERADHHRAAACLARAMAVQWMLGRRAIASRIVVGIAPGTATARGLHAWVEVGPHIVIGADLAAAHVPTFALMQGTGGA